MNKRDGFREIADGWIYDGFELLNERIERLAGWSKANAPLLPDEEATVKVMIDSLVAKSIHRGDFEPFIHGDDHDHDEADEDLYDDPGISDRERI